MEDKTIGKYPIPIDNPSPEAQEAWADLWERIARFPSGVKSALKTWIAELDRAVKLRKEADASPLVEGYRGAQVSNPKFRLAEAAQKRSDRAGRLAGVFATKDRRRDAAQVGVNVHTGRTFKEERAEFAAEHAEEFATSDEHFAETGHYWNDPRFTGDCECKEAAS